VLRSASTPAASTTSPVSLLTLTAEDGRPRLGVAFFRPQVPIKSNVALGKAVVNSEHMRTLTTAGTDPMLMRWERISPE
jgi:hypothetical protein